MSLNITDLPPSWYESAYYRPRLKDSTNWFLLAEAFRPVTEMPRTAPDEPQAGRVPLREAFEATYRGWRLPRFPATEKSLDQIAERGSAVIVAGQQPGFLGGPLFTVLKALTAVAAAEVYQRETGRPTTPVFWVAGDDHDLDEVRTTYFPGPGGDDMAFSYPGDMDRRPVAAYAVDETVHAVLDAAREHLKARRCAKLAAELIDLYRGRNLASGFAALMTELLGRTGLLVVDPVHLRPLGAPLMKRVIESPERVLKRIQEGRETVHAQGLKPVVGDRLPLFVLLDGKRHHLSPVEGESGLRVDGGGPAFSRDALLEKLAAEPASFSAGALLRPLLQQSVLPCVLTIGGAAEVAYYAQLAPLAEELGVTPPNIALRLGATLLDGQVAKLASVQSVLDAALAGSPEEFLQQETPLPEGDAVEKLARHAGEILRRVVTSLPKSLPQARRLDAGVDKIVTDIQRFGDRAANAWTKTREAELGRARKLFGHLFPGGALQERRWNVLHFVAKHGTGWIEELLEYLVDDPLKIAHRLVVFEGNEKPNDD